MASQGIEHEGQPKTNEPSLITFKSNKINIYLNYISLQLYVIYLITFSIYVVRVFVLVAMQWI